MIEAPVQTITLIRAIQAPVGQVYSAFTDLDAMRDWLADYAHLRAEVGGHLFALWPPSHYATGVYTALEKDARAAFNWREAGQFVDSEVEVVIEGDGSSTNLTFRLGGFAPEAEVEALQREWEERLDHLKHVLETGEDARITHRVIIGIRPNSFDKDDAERLGIPVSEGTRVGSAIPNMGAEAAGLQTDDVVVAVNGQDVTNQRPMFALVKGRRPGDVVDITYYRGSVKHETRLKLSGYPTPEVAANFTALAERLQTVYAGIDSELTALLDGVSDEQAGRKPAPKEWSAKEVLAHLILSERWQHGWLGSLLVSPEVEGWSANHAARLGGLMAVHPTAQGLLAELRRAWAETVAIIGNVPESAAEYKATLWWMNFEVDGMALHGRQHLGQIQAALAARG